MTTQNSVPSSGSNSFSFSSRDLIAIGFRHKHTILVTFFAILLGAIAAAILQPAQYQASTKFLVERSRVDPIVSPGQDPNVIREEVTEEELNSEVELLQSDDVLRQVVLAAGLDQRRSLLSYLGIQRSEEIRIAKATAQLVERFAD